MQCPRDVSFTPESGHRLVALPCPLCAKSGGRRSKVSYVPSESERIDLK
jgi:hypothetical protein